MPTLAELRQERGRLIEQARDIQRQADTEDRAMLDEEVQNFDRAMEDADALKATIDRKERLSAAEEEVEESQGAQTVEGRGGQPYQPERHVQGRITQEDKTAALRAWLIAGSDKNPTEDGLQAASRLGINPTNKKLKFDLPSRTPKSTGRDDVRAWREDIEKRAQSTTTTAGGYTVPDDMMQALEVAMKEFGGMYQVADVIRTDRGSDLPWPTVNDTGNKGALLGENTQVSAQDFTFGQLVLQAYKYSSKIVLVSTELLQDSAVNIPEIVGSGLGERLGRIHNEHFTTGTGSSQPNGIVTASTLGKTGASTTAVAYDDFVDLLHSVDPAYRMNSRWMFADATLKSVRKIKVPQYSGDTAGQPLWQPGLAAGEPDTILGYPYTVNQDMPTMEASAKSILFGALGKYKVRQVREVTLMRLDERYADYHQVAFLAFSRADGDLLDAGTNPVKHFANAAS